MIHAFIKKGCFQDSVSLMIISRKLSESENVDDVSVMMGTPANKSLLETTGFWHDDFNQATPNDICVAIRTEAADESITRLFCSNWMSRCSSWRRQPGEPNAIAGQALGKRVPEIA